MSKGAEEGFCNAENMFFAKTLLAAYHTFIYSKKQCLYPPSRRAQNCIYVCARLPFSLRIKIRLQTTINIAIIK